MLQSNNQIQFLYSSADSIGSIYGIPSGNNPLDTQFLQIKFINYSQKVQDKTIAQTSAIEKPNKTNFLSFAYSDFVLLTLIILFGLVVFVRISGKNYFSRLFMSVLNYSYSTSFFREKNLAYVLYNNIQLFVFFMSCGLLSTMIAQHYGVNIPDTESFTELLIFTGIIAFLVFLNRFLTRIGGKIFGNYKLAAEYLFYYANMLRLVGILLLGLSLILSFVGPTYKGVFIFIVFLVVGIVYLVKTLRIFIIFLSNRLSLYYLILYFCALEIIPFILLIKVVVLVIQNNYSFSGILV